MIARGFLALLTVAVFAIGFHRSYTRSNDFDSFYDAAHSVWSDGTLVETKGTQRYLPSFQVLMAPLGALPIRAAAGVWLGLALASYVGLAWIFARVFGVSPRDQVPAWLCVAPFVVSNVTLGQSGPLLLALSTAGVAFSARGRDGCAGAALTVAGLLKVLPTALLAVPLGLGRVGRTLVGVVATAAVVAVAMTVAIGPDAAWHDSLRWVTEVRGDQTPQQLIEAVRSLRYNNQGLAVTLARTFGDFSVLPQQAAPGSTQLLSLPLAWVWAFYAALVAGLCGVFVAVAWRVRSRRPTPPRAFLGILGLAVTPMLAVSPIVWTHYFLWLLPGFVYLARHRAVLYAIAPVSLAAIYVTEARGLGFHMALALAQFAWLAREIWRDSRETDGPERAAT